MTRKINKTMLLLTFVDFEVISMFGIKIKLLFKGIKRIKLNVCYYCSKYSKILFWALII